MQCLNRYTVYNIEFVIIILIEMCTYVRRRRGFSIYKCSRITDMSVRMLCIVQWNYAMHIEHCVQFVFHLFVQLCAGLDNSCCVLSHFVLMPIYWARSTHIIRLLFWFTFTYQDTIKVLLAFFFISFGLSFHLYIIHEMYCILCWFCGFFAFPFSTDYELRSSPKHKTAAIFSSIFCQRISNTTNRFSSSQASAV